MEQLGINYEVVTNEVVTPVKGGDVAITQQVIQITGGANIRRAEEKGAVVVGKMPANTSLGVI